MKKLFTACLLLFTLMILFSAPAYAGDEGGDEPLFEVEDGVITAYLGDDTDVVIPSVYDGQTIIGIGENAFSCWGLTSVELPNTLLTIGDYAFEYNDITELTLPDGVTEIGSGAFEGCVELSSVRLPAKLETIAPRAFCATAITEIEIPATVTEIGERAFYECTSLRNFKVSASNKVYKSEGGALFTKDGKEMISYGSGHTASSYSIPDGVELLHPSTFSYCEALKQVEMPESLTLISNWAFGHTGLTSVVLPPNLQELDFNAFGYCEALTSASLPLTLTEIGQTVFAGCPLEHVYYEGTEANWSAIDINDDNQELLAAERHYNERIYCAHENMTFHAAVPRTCTEDGAIAYWQCNQCGGLFQDAGASVRVDDIVIPAAHSYESAVTLAPNCAEAGIRTFTCTVCAEGTPGHSYTEEIPATGNHHYVDGTCDNILHDGVSVCGKPAPTVVASGVCGYNNNVPENIIVFYFYGNDTFNVSRYTTDSLEWTLDSDGTLTVSGEGDMCSCLYGEYRNNYGYTTGHTISSPWYAYRNRIETVVLEEGVTSVGMRCFYDCAYLTEVHLPQSLTAIRSNAFTNTDLEDVYYYGTLDQWDDVQKTGLSVNSVTMHFVNAVPPTPDLILPESLTAIGSEAFKGIAAAAVRIPPTVLGIANDAFDKDVTFLVESGSYAETWARTNHRRYFVE